MPRCNHGHPLTEATLPSDTGRATLARTGDAFDAKCGCGGCVEWEWSDMCAGDDSLYGRCVDCRAGYTATYIIVELEMYEAPSGHGQA